MDKQERQNEAQLLRKGLKELALHRPDKAIETLRLAVEATPPSCSDELSRALYWLSVALFRLDKRELAIKSLSSAQKLRRRGYARRVYLRSINGYGMQKQPTAELDDFYAFTNIQMASYLSKKPRRRFDSFQERETVLRIVIDAWKNIKASSILEDHDCCEKLVFFRHYKPGFPSFGLGEGQRRTIKANFGQDQIQQADPSQRCICGSGLPFGRCCGRVHGLGEL
jgi:tetratricopeptide (TPR) repeat protein